MERLKQLNELKELGCKDLSKCATALQLLVELRPVMHDVSCHYDESLQLLYITAKQQLDQNTEHYIPLPSSAPIELPAIDRIQSRLGVKSIIVALMDGSATFIYYKMSSGWRDLDATFQVDAANDCI